MKITAYQFAVSSDIRKNLETMEKAIREAGDRQTDLVVFPELAYSGYFCPSLQMQQLAEYAEAVEQAIGRPLEIVSGGATSSLMPVFDKEIPPFSFYHVFVPSISFIFSSRHIRLICHSRLSAFCLSVYSSE